MTITSMDLMTDAQIALALEAGAKRIRDQSDSIRYLQSRLRQEIALREAGNVSTTQRDDPRYRGDGTLVIDRPNIMDSPIVKEFIERAKTAVDEIRDRRKTMAGEDDPILTDEELAVKFLEEKQANLERTRLLNERMERDLKDD